MTHPLTARLLRNRASFYQELLIRIPWEKFRRELELAVIDLSELEPPDNVANVLVSDESSALLSTLKLDEWLKKDDTGIPRARRVISIETALDEACHLEQLGILLCDVLEKTERNNKSIKAAHERAFIALCDLRDRLEFHRIILLDPSCQLQRLDNLSFRQFPGIDVTLVHLEIDQSEGIK